MQKSQRTDGRVMHSWHREQLEAQERASGNPRQNTFGSIYLFPATAFFLIFVTKAGPCFGTGLFNRLGLFWTAVHYLILQLPAIPAVTAQGLFSVDLFSPHIADAGTTWCRAQHSTGNQSVILTREVQCWYRISHKKVFMCEQNWDGCEER